jgi:hypothetical protein
MVVFYLLKPFFDFIPLHIYRQSRVQQSREHVQGGFSGGDKLQEPT